ncbi:hypothetical protein KBD45_01630, partial [Candidatus Dojkabacteria bacterium]|nr:hypothetical protein [Candidatus Dojkabacteria bacterium]
MKKFVSTLICIGIITQFTVFPIRADDIVVDVLTDSIDNNIGDGICSDDEGNCSLRAAIMEINASGVSDTIYLPSGSGTGTAIYELTLTGTGEDMAVSGDLDITRNLTMVGQGLRAEDVVIDFNGIDQGFHVMGSSGVISVDFTNLSIINSSGDTNVKGGAFDLNNTTFTGNNIVLTGNTTTGSGSASFGGYDAQVQLINSLVYEQTGGQGSLAKIHKGAFYSNTSTIYDLSSDLLSGTGSGLVNIEDCVSYQGAGSIIDCQVRFDRTTISSITSDTFLGGISGV